MILGISLDENYVYVSVDGNSDALSFPFAIGKNLNNKEWFVGDETRSENIDSVDIVIDKLFYLMENSGTARIGEEEYEAKDLVKIFFSNLLSKFEEIEYVTVVTRFNKIKIFSTIDYALFKYFNDRKRYKVTTYSEAFLSYLGNKDLNYYKNGVSLFNFTEKAITYFELVRYMSEDNIEYWNIETENYFSLPLDLLSENAGSLICDNLLLDFAKKCIGDKLLSNIILSGIGFTNSPNYREFMTYVCSITNVETSINFFSSSACNFGKINYKNFINEKILFSDARTTAAINIYTDFNDEKQKINLIKPGEEWFYIDNSFDIIYDNVKEIHFEVVKVLEGIIKDKAILIPEEIKLRPDKTNVLEINLKYEDQNLLNVNVSDMGFGDFFESSKISTTVAINV